MEKYQIYEDIKTRTNGDIYVGVVGPVRVGKSTFISEFLTLKTKTAKNALSMNFHKAQTAKQS